MSSETRLRRKDFQGMSQDSKSDPNRKSSNRRHNVRCIVRQHERAVVRPDIGDIAVLSTAELGIIIACLRICWDGRA